MANCTVKICSDQCPQWCNDNLPPPSHSSTHLSPSAIAGYVVASIIVLVVLVGGIWNWLFGNGNHHQNLPPPPPQLVRRLDVKTISQIPLRAYQEGDGEDCSICFRYYADMVEESRLVRVLPPFFHVFHSECVDLWLGQRGTCPWCKAAVALPVPAAAADPEPQPEPEGDAIELQPVPEGDAVLVHEDND